MTTNTGASRPRRLHHAAWVTRDMEVTRQFYEDVIGIPLVATWAEKNSQTGLEYCHTFFEFEDGGALAFFQWGDQDENPKDQNSPGHIAFECDAETQAGIKARLEQNDYPIRVTDHGYCISLYVQDPNNLKVEFTVDHPDCEKIMANQRKTAHADLKRWMSGDHSVNNDFRTG
jgi:catechol 2,3-dioxygenase-like lactoylglutathione lyase family enzyme